LGSDWDYCSSCSIMWCWRVVSCEIQEEGLDVF
jgi:hypothetical protein